MVDQFLILSHQVCRVTALNRKELRVVEHCRSNRPFNDIVEQALSSYRCLPQAEALRSCYCPCRSISLAPISPSVKMRALVVPERGVAGGQQRTRAVASLKISCSDLGDAIWYGCSTDLSRRAMTPRWPGTWLNLLRLVSEPPSVLFHALCPIGNGFS